MRKRLAAVLARVACKCYYNLPSVLSHRPRSFVARSGKYFPLQIYLIYLQELAIQIHRHLVCEGSPAPIMINKPLTVLDPERDKSLLQTYTKTQKHSPPLTVTPKIIEFPETDVGKVSGRWISIQYNTIQYNTIRKFETFLIGHLKFPCCNEKWGRTTANQKRRYV